MRPLPLAFAITILLISLATPASSQDYTFTDMVNTTQGLTPTFVFGLDENGTILFSPSNTEPELQGIYSASAGQFERIATSPASTIGVSGSGLGAIWGYHPEDNQNGIRRINPDGTIRLVTPVALPSGGIAINDAGQVAYCSFAPDFSFLQVHLADTSTDLVIAEVEIGSYCDPSINNAGEVAFVSQPLDQEFGVYKYAQGRLVQIESGDDAYISQTANGITSDGKVAYWAEASGSTGIILREEAGERQFVAIASTDFIPRLGFAVNDQHQNVFVGSQVTTRPVTVREGLFTGQPNPRYVIGKGDSLFGKTVALISLPVVTARVLNNRGQIVFHYQMTDGTEGIALATPELPAPVLEQGSAVNGASYLPGLVPGSWAQVKGTNLSTVTRIWQEADFTDGSNLPTSLSGVSLTVNGLPAAVYYISPAQVSFQVPAGVSGTVEIQVIRDGKPSNVITAMAVASAPALFTYAVGGKTFPAAVYANTSLVVGDPAASGSSVRKARPGDHIALYATALAPSPAGVIVIPAGLSGVTATIGTSPATVEFAGLVAVGQFQINIVVPDLPSGEYTLQVQIDGQSSQPGVVIPIVQ